MTFFIRFWTTLILVMSPWAFPSPSGAYQENPHGAGVVVKGQVTFKGKVPESKSLEVNRDEKFCGQSMPDESLLVAAQSKGISNIVVSLDGIASGKALPQKTPVPMNNQDCRFQPPVSLGLTGSQLEISSSDPILHNTHILQQDQTFLNVALPPGGRTIRKTVSQSGYLGVRCDAHPFMRASIHIFDHPYFTSTNRTGHFELTQVPPGTYRLQFWHQTLGVKEVSIKVTKSAPLVVNVNFP